MKRLTALIIAAILAGVLALILLLAILSGKSEDPLSQILFACNDPSKHSMSRSYQSAAASSDGVPCASVAIGILKRNGTAADAAVAAMFCVGVVNAQSAGVGGGFVATYYSREKEQVFALDAREVAPINAYEDMYNPEINTKLKEYSDTWWMKKGSAIFKGPLSVAVPGEVDGLYALYMRFGGALPWKELLEPAIKLCEKGYRLTSYTGGFMQLSKKDILAEPSMSIFRNPTNGKVFKNGDLVKRPQLAKTLRRLQENPHALKQGILADNLVSDIQALGGIITKEDLQQYRPIWRDPVSFSLKTPRVRLVSFPPPGSGLLLGLILNILDELNLDETSLNEKNLAQTHHTVAEAFKYAFARRYLLGNLNATRFTEVVDDLTSEALAMAISNRISFNETSNKASDYGAKMNSPPNDQGTAHFNLVSPNGDAIAITSSINYGFGAGFISPKTGILLNNQMSDFTTPEKQSKVGSLKMENNRIIPGNRPLSSMSPTIVLNEDNSVRMVIGGSGGVKIISAVSWVMARHLFMNQSLSEATDSCRTHHSLLPMKLQYENGLQQSIILDLESKGHETEQYRWISVVVGISRDLNGKLTAVADYRKTGQVDGFWY